MPTVAERLQQAREARNLSIEQIADITKIRTDHLRALETGDYDVFSAPVYIRGFVRTYSTLLKLDVAEVMATLDAELGQSNKFSEPPPLTDRSRGVVDFISLQLSKIDWPKAAVLIAIIAVLGGIVTGVILWRHNKSKDHLKGLEPGLYQPKQGSGETLPLPNQKK